MRFRSESIVDQHDLGAEDETLGARHPLALYRAHLQLSYLRASWLVAKRLAEIAPTEHLWEDFQQDPLYLQTLEELADVIEDIRASVSFEEVPTPDEVSLAVQQHYQRGLECVAVLGERLDVAPEDLLTVLVQSGV